MMANLLDKIATVIHTESGERIDAAAQLGGRHYRATFEWAEIERIEGEYNWTRSDACMESLRKVTAIPPYVSCFMTPAWVAPDVPPKGDPNAPFVPFLPKDGVLKWQAFLEALLARYPELTYIGLDTEINYIYFWTGTPEEYAANVVIPASEVIRRHGMKVVAPGVTIQKYESDLHYAKSKDYMMRFLKLALEKIDFICFHSYGKSAERVYKQIVSFCNETGISMSKLMLTETGFTENYYWCGEDFLRSLSDLFISGQERQRNRYKTFLKWIKNDAWAQRLLLVILYRAWDTPEAPKETHGLMKPDYVLKLAGKYFKEQLGEEIPK